MRPIQDDPSGREPPNSRPDFLFPVVHDAASSGSVENEVKYTYDAWGNAIKIEQDRDSAVGGGGTAAYDVDFTYDEGGVTEATSVFTRIHRTKIAYPNSTELSFYFGNGTLDTIGLPTQVNFMMGRVEQVKIKPSGGADVVEAMDEYLGTGHVSSPARLLPGSTRRDPWR